MEQFQVQMDEEYYRIGDPAGEEFGPIVPYGEMATLRVGDAIYYAIVEDGNEWNPQVFRVDRVTKMPSELDEVEFPKVVIAAQRRLDDILGEQAAVLDATVDEITEGPEGGH